MLARDFMSRALLIGALCGALVLPACSNHSDEGASACVRGADEASRVETARALVTVDASNFRTLINYWAEDVVHREPVLTNTGRAEVAEYFAAMYSGSSYGFPPDRRVVVRDELYQSQQDGGMTYMATVQWSGTFGNEFFLQNGMSIVKFRPGEGCPYYQRDYVNEGDTWWNVPAFKPQVELLRNMYISIFGLSLRCFDDDADGYAKYSSSAGCPLSGLDCNDFVPEINPAAMEIPGNGIDEDCDVATPFADPASQDFQ
jgi:hypothetical protein